MALSRSETTGAVDSFSRRLAQLGKRKRSDCVIRDVHTDEPAPRTDAPRTGEAESIPPSISRGLLRAGNALKDAANGR